MARILRRAITIVALLSLGALIMLVMWPRPVTSGRVEIQNKSGTEIKELEVEVSKNRFLFWNLPDGSAVEFTYPITIESGYKIKVSLASGTSFESKAGYVTRGFDFSDRLIVSPDTLQFEREKVTKP